MRTARGAAVSLLAILTLTQGPILSASAEQPSIGRCVKVAAGTGGYTTSTCIASGVGSYEWYPGFTGAKPLAKSKFALTIKETTTFTSDTVTLGKVTCKGQSGTGEYTASKTVGNVFYKFTGCEALLTSCTSPGAAAGEIKTERLQGVLGIDTTEPEASKDKVGLDLYPSGAGLSKEELLAEFACGGVPYKWRGPVIVPFPTNKVAIKYTLKYAETAGKQKPERFEGGPKQVLETSLSGGAFEQSGWKLTSQLTDEEKVEVSTVAPSSHDTWEDFTALSPMPAGLRPGSPTSPFNTEVGAPKDTANSEKEVKWFLANIGSLESQRPGGAALPVVYASNSDPEVELVHATVSGSKFSTNVDKRKVRIPTAAKVGDTGDKHIAIVLAPNNALVPGETIDLELAESLEEGGTTEGTKLKIVEGKLNFAGGGHGNMNSNLLQELSSVSTNWSAIAGQVRAQELKAGMIPHALATVMHKAKKAFVYPASDGDGNDTSEESAPTGRRFYLNYSDAAIDGLAKEHAFKPWKVAMLKSMSHYGFYIEDTGGCEACFRYEGALDYEPFGAPEPFSQIGAEQGVPFEGGKYHFRLLGDTAKEIEEEKARWSEHLHAIEPPPE
jgi:hypothetical protein